MRVDRGKRARALVCMVLPVAVVLAGCGDEATVRSATEDMLLLDSSVGFGIVAYLTQNGVREGRVQADTAYTAHDSNTLDLRDMRVDFYDEDGGERATITSRQGQWDQDTNRMTAIGDVVLLVHSDGSKIESERINYDPEEDRIWSDRPTTRTFANGRATSGTAFESDIDFENVRIENPRGAAGRVFN